MLSWNSSWSSKHSSRMGWGVHHWTGFPQRVSPAHLPPSLPPTGTEHSCLRLSPSGCIMKWLRGKKLNLLAHTATDMAPCSSIHTLLSSCISVKGRTTNERKDNNNNNKPLLPAAGSAHSLLAVVESCGKEQARQGPLTLQNPVKSDFSDCFSITRWIGAEKLQRM